MGAGVAVGHLQQAEDVGGAGRVLEFCHPGYWGYQQLFWQGVYFGGWQLVGGRGCAFCLQLQELSFVSHGKDVLLHKVKISKTSAQ